VNNLPKVVTQRCLEQHLNPRPTDRKSNALPVALPRHLLLYYIYKKLLIELTEVISAALFRKLGMMFYENLGIKSRRREYHKILGVTLKCCLETTMH